MALLEPMATRVKVEAAEAPKLRSEAEAEALVDVGEGGGSEAKPGALVSPC